MLKTHDGTPTIEKGVPPPPVQRSRYKSVISTLRAMEIGDSISIDGGNGESYRTASYRLADAEFRSGHVDGVRRLWRIS